MKTHKHIREKKKKKIRYIDFEMPPTFHKRKQPNQIIKIMVVDE